MTQQNKKNNTEKLKYKHINFNGEEGYDVSKLLRKNDRDLYKLRRSMEDGHSVALCEGCEQELRIANANLYRNKMGFTYLVFSTLKI